MTDVDPRPRRGNLGATRHGQCRVVWTSERLDSIEVGTVILVRVGTAERALPCYVIAKLPQRHDEAGRSHQAVARCGIVESLLIPGEEADPPDLVRLPGPQPST